jgi:hypothetical protein
MGDEVTPGMHQQVRDSGVFNADEWQIVNVLSREWYVTRGGEVWLGPSRERGSSFRFVLLKPTRVYQDMFNLDREIIGIFSSYDRFEPRTFDAIDRIANEFQRLRLEKICNVVMARDPLVGDKVRDFLKGDEESQIIVPFAFDEIVASRNDYFMRNRFKEHFYTRDLFAFEGPLKRDRYFFGRTDLIHRIVNRHASNENSGLFGLRRSGKTSVIFGIERAVDIGGSKSVVIDCHDPAFHRRRWNEALWYVVYQLAAKYKLQIELTDEKEYTEKNASLLFEQRIREAASLLGGSVLLIFDEIENITHSISPSEHWCSDLDFVYFWQALRSAYQRSNEIFSFSIVGTNPLCIESATIADKQNPLFMALPFEYLEPFDVPQTREMIRKLGRTMGLQFDEKIYSKLTEDYGGHPFLMRHACSVINKLAPRERPVTVTRSLYERAAESFDQQYVNYIRLILSVLQQYYRDEYDMLCMLAAGDVANFDAFARESPNYTNHLIGYGVIERTDAGFDFRIDAVKKFLSMEQKYQKVQQTIEEMWREIGERRNALEPRLRLVIRNQLRAAYGEADAKNRVLGILASPRREAAVAVGYKDIFLATKVPLYFDDLRKILSKEWAVFTNIFEGNRERLLDDLKAINSLRADAHAKPIGRDDMSYFRVCIGRVERLITEYNE